jgi:hypothetical protein
VHPVFCSPDHNTLWLSALQAERVQEEHRAARLTAEAQVGGELALLCPASFLLWHLGKIGGALPCLA